MDLGYDSRVDVTRHILGLDQDIGKIKQRMNRSRGKRFEELYRENSVDIIKPDKNDLLEFYKYYRKFQQRSAVLEKKVDFILGLEELQNQIRIVRTLEDQKGYTQHLYILDKRNSQLNHLLTGTSQKSREKNASEIIHAHMIRWAQDEDFSTYNFGKNSGDFRKGLFRFKNEYGTEKRPVVGWRKSFSKVKKALYDIGLEL